MLHTKEPMGRGECERPKQRRPNLGKASLCKPDIAVKVQQLLILREIQQSSEQGSPMIAVGMECDKQL